MDFVTLNQADWMCYWCRWCDEKLFECWKYDCRWLDVVLFLGWKLSHGLMMCNLQQQGIVVIVIHLEHSTVENTNIDVDYADSEIPTVMMMMMMCK